MLSIPLAERKLENIYGKHKLNDFTASNPYIENATPSHDENQDDIDLLDLDFESECVPIENKNENFWFEVDSVVSMQVEGLDLNNNDNTANLQTTARKHPK